MVHQRCESEWHTHQKWSRMQNIYQRQSMYLFEDISNKFNFRVKKITLLKEDTLLDKDDMLLELEDGVQLRAGTSDSFVIHGFWRLTAWLTRLHCSVNGLVMLRCISQPPQPNTQLIWNLFLFCFVLFCFVLFCFVFVLFICSLLFRFLSPPPPVRTQRSQCRTRVVELFQQEVRGIMAHLVVW